jgi:hypothetical protein
MLTCITTQKFWETRAGEHLQDGCKCATRETPLDDYNSHRGKHGIRSSDSSDKLYPATPRGPDLVNVINTSIEIPPRHWDLRERMARNQLLG